MSQQTAQMATIRSKVRSKWVGVVQLVVSRKGHKGSGKVGQESETGALSSKERQETESLNRRVEPSRQGE
jgi:hypothetical protein